MKALEQQGSARRYLVKINNSGSKCVNFIYEIFIFLEVCRVPSFFQFSNFTPAFYEGSFFEPTRSHFFRMRTLYFNVFFVTHPVVGTLGCEARPPLNTL